jgi:hypothetical protein
VGKACVYLERSKSSPITLHLYEAGDLSPHNPFLHIVPHAVGQLKSLVAYGTPGNLQDITARLCRPAPLLEYLSINGDYGAEVTRNPALTTALFDGDLTSLRELRLQSVRTELPWRNMINLTSFALGHTSPGELLIKQLLDFFESAPHLREIELRYANPIFDPKNGRLVSLACLKTMEIVGDDPGVHPSLLLNHLIIPIGAELTTQADSHGPLIEGHRSLDNLRNLPNFTDIYLRMDEGYTQIQFIGPNGRVCMVGVSPRGDPTRLVLESLARFDTSEAKLLKIDRGNSPSSDLPYRALLPMKHLHTLTLFQCTSPDIFIHALDPSISSSGVVVCPKLEELVLVLRRDGETLNINNVIGMAAARASRGAKLESVRIISDDKSMQIDALELEKHASHVECGPWVGVANEDGDSGDEGGWWGE